MCVDGCFGPAAEKRAQRADVVEMAVREENGAGRDGSEALGCECGDARGVHGNACVHEDPVAHYFVGIGLADEGDVYEERRQVIDIWWERL